MRSGWMSWVRTTAAGLALVAGVWAQGAGAAEPEVKNVTAAFLWPWTNAVGISFEVEGTVPTNAALVVTAKDVTSNTTYPVFGLTGDTGTDEGGHHVVWNLDQQGVKIQSTNVVFTVAYETNVYCVVDLSAGANASSYPVTYQPLSEKSLLYDYEYKTTKLVLRRIEPGTFQMGGRYQTTLTKPYYMGVFEVTQRQWELVTGSNPSSYKGDRRPVENVSYDMIRGSVVGTNWPVNSAVDATSFLGMLRTRTGLEFDLPTEAQWEYACRAGTTSEYNNGGNSEDGLKQLGRYSDNRSDGKGGYSQHTTVGSYQPNAWGLYDMHGNVWEYCLDWYGSLTGDVTDPEGSPSGSGRVGRGGSWNFGAEGCALSTRLGAYPSREYNDCGFRLSKVLSE